MCVLYESVKIEKKLFVISGSISHTLEEEEVVLLCSAKANPKVKNNLEVHLTSLILLRMSSSGGRKIT